MEFDSWKKMRNTNNDHNISVNGRSINNFFHTSKQFFENSECTKNETENEK